jgi:ADP-ribose pyrophosphatase
MSPEVIASTPQHQCHRKARFDRPPEYPDRLNIFDEQVPWDTDYPYYDELCPTFNHPKLATASWADPSDWRQVDLEKRGSLEGPLTFDDSGCPLNPRGRTGLSGRGLLGKWGANFAADPIITRFNPYNGQLEMVAILRSDGGGWAIPGGMVDDKESFVAAGTREALEEALKSGQDLDNLLPPNRADCVYKGYVDDRRNTDHAWMETQAFHWHLTDADGQTLELEHGDDAAGVQWMPITVENLDLLYANHGEFVRLALQNMEDVYPEEIGRVTANVKTRLE